MKKSYILLVVFALLGLGACAHKSAEDARIDSLLEQMTLREKVGQVFFVRPEYLDPRIDIWRIDTVMPIASTSLTPEMREMYDRYPAGGVVLYAHNIVCPSQLDSFTAELSALRYSPVLSIDEEGGRVARIARNSAFGLRRFPPMAEVALGGPDSVSVAADYIGDYLSHYRITMDFAPVADVNSNPLSPVIGSRAFSSDSDTTAAYVLLYMDGLAAHGVGACVKHYPGHGEVATDTHHGYAELSKSRDEIMACEMIPFRAAIEHGTECIMVAHITVPSLDSTALPATLSSTLLEDLLRGELGYDGLIMSDALEMGAICDNYTPGEAAVLCLLAGNDIILGPRNYPVAFEAVLEAVEQGRISETLLNEKVRRILRYKLRHGLMVL